jgi:hypothetical protein
LERIERVREREREREEENRERDQEKESERTRGQRDTERGKPPAPGDGVEGRINQQQSAVPNPDPQADLPQVIRSQSKFSTRSTQCASTVEVVAVFRSGRLRR